MNLSLKACALIVLMPLGGKDIQCVLYSVQLILTSEHNYCDTDVPGTIMFVLLKCHFRI